MNYRHGFHAGNFADVLKHVALYELIRLLTAKDKKLFVLDTHAGSGSYDLASDLAVRTREAEAGVTKLAAAAKAGAPAAVLRYLAAVAAYDRKFGVKQGPPRHYPGSPRLIRAGLRPNDRLIACEMHPAEAQALKREFAGDRSVDVRQADGYHAMKAMLPPSERRALVLIDPPFEVTDEFDKLLRAVRHGLRRFATGCYAIWYPIKDEEAVAAFMTALAGPKTLRLELRVPETAPGRLTACGLLVINPPWKFEEAMGEALLWIAGVLGGRASVVAPPASPHSTAPAPASAG